MELEKYSMGVGDRFAHQAKAQLQAMLMAKEVGINIVPVWNKSHREHTTIGSEPSDVRIEADRAVKELNWKESYYVDADHINLNNVDLFIESSDFFTLDVADFTGQHAAKSEISSFVHKFSKYSDSLIIPGIETPFKISVEQIEYFAKKYLKAVQEAAKIYRHIEKIKKTDNFITEVSMDETDQPQTPVEMLFILAAIAEYNIPAQTIAPKFTGRFNKGIDYVGDLGQFEKEFNEDIAVIQFAVQEFGLPKNLKLSVHSGSDKFSLYGSINRALTRFNAGVHVKTAGTTWLEELIGLAESGNQGLEIVKEIYQKSYEQYDQLCAPYATVIDIDRERLPEPSELANWDSSAFVSALRHDKSCQNYNPSLRQLLHVGYKVAAKMKQRYLDALEIYERNVSVNVTKNIYTMHIEPLFLGAGNKACN